MCDRAILAFMPNRLVRVPTSHAKQGKSREPQAKPCADSLSDGLLGMGQGHKLSINAQQHASVRRFIGAQGLKGGHAAAQRGSLEGWPPAQLEELVQGQHGDGAGLGWP